MKTICALVCLSIAGAAAAAPRTGSWKVGNDSYHIYYADLDTGTVRGRAALLARIERSARKLCDVPTRAEERECVAKVVAKVDRGAVHLALTERKAAARTAFAVKKAGASAPAF